MEILLENISLQIKKDLILKNINLCLPQGKLIMLLGENGAGKTQLIKTIMGFKKPTTGKVCYNGESVLKIDVKNRARFVSYVPQGDNQDVHYTVNEFVTMGTMPSLGFYQAPTGQMQARVQQILGQIGISHLGAKFTDEISGGELRLCYLARALVQNTPWMVLDEPVASLDFGKQHSFLRLIKETAVKHNKGTLMSIHDPSLACRYADILILMKKGEIWDIINMDNNPYQRLEQALATLYGENIKFEDTSQGKVLTWKENLE